MSNTDHSHDMDCDDDSDGFGTVEYDYIVTTHECRCCGNPRGAYHAEDCDA